MAISTEYYDPGPVVDLGADDNLLVNPDVVLTAQGGAGVLASGSNQSVRCLAR